MSQQPPDDRYSIKVVERCFQILDLACSLQRPVSIPDVIQELGVNANMAFRLLQSIAGTGYMEKDPETGLYSLSMKTLRLSTTALQSQTLRKLTMPHLELLWTRYPKANVNMAIRSGDDILIVDRIDGQSMPRTYFTPGKKVPFHCSGLGKVLTCTLSEDEIRAMAEREGLKAFTENTITDADALVKELASVRAEGVGRDRNEFIPRDNCSAVPILDKNGQIVAAISVSALEDNMSADEIEACIPKLKETASCISMMIGYSVL